MGIITSSCTCINWGLRCHHGYPFLVVIESCSLLYVGSLPSPVDVLRGPMVDIQFQPGSSSSGKNKDVKEFNIGKWDISASDLREISTFCSSKLGGRVFPPSRPYHHWPAPSALCFASEAETNDVCEIINCHICLISCSNATHTMTPYLHHLSRFFNDVCVRINEIYVCCEVQLAWRLNPPSQLPNNSLPDFVLMPLDGSSVEEMAGEGKVKT